MPPFTDLPTQSIVKISATVTSPNYLEPWANPRTFDYIGSGVIIKDNQILTSAHVVRGAILLLIVLHGKNIWEIRKKNLCY
jgi:S1-C subfamily serine protease